MSLEKPKDDDKNIRDIVNKISNNSDTDDFIIRVRGGDINSEDESKRPTNPMKLALSILRALNKNPEGYVKVNSVGPKALNVTMKSFRIASNILAKRTTGVVLVLRQSEYTADLGENKKATGICTRIFPVPTKYAL